ncbi:MAG: HDIG domain-containing protein [Marinilabiliaceae bacterium]|nr:HDIG domain-containing protein [Marinilabiliaceae bacterium]
MVKITRNRVFRVLAFIVSSVIIVFSFPEVEKFSYEYELQRPWRYQNLIAPFDFSIIKTDVELNAERDSLRRNMRPIFRKDSIGSMQVFDEVKPRLESVAQKFQLLCPNEIDAEDVLLFVAESLTKHLSSEYATGVIEIPDLFSSEGLSELSLIRGNILEPFSIEEFHSMREAYSIASEKLQADFNVKYGADAQWHKQLLQSLPLAEMIIANVTFDAEKTDAELEQRLDNLSIAQGKVLAGQRIIGTGDIVDKRSAKILDSLRKASEEHYGQSTTETPIVFGEALMTLCLMVTLFLFIFFFHRDVFTNLRTLLFVLIIVVLFIVGASVLSARHENITFVVPYVILPITLRLFLDSRIAMYIHTLTILFVSFMAHNSQLFLVLHIPAGMIAIISLMNLTRRWQLMRTAILVFCYYALCYWGYTIWQTGDLVHSSGSIPYVLLAINSILILLCYPAVYILERIFSFVSDVTLLELSDTNSPLLRELSEKAPGTFQHSIQVANLAQEVAYHIGANAMLVRAGAMYHDIGKIVSPMFFTENQVGGVNPHNELEFTESAQIVIRHVQNGIQLAKKKGIPRQIIDIIATHHGNTTAKYFYIAWCNAHPDQEPDLSLFSYNGPTPYTKEQAITMMVDAVEASSKSLKTYTDESIDQLVERIVTSQVEDKQFNLSPLTFNDIEVSKQVMKDKLKNIYHARIQYPELMK